MIFITGGMAQGKTTFASSFHLPIVDNLETHIQTWLARGADVEAELATLLPNEPCVIVCAEIGCGIVPLEKTDRIWREVTGRTACKFATLAEEVYKVEAGIPIRLK